MTGLFCEGSWGKLVYRMPIFISADEAIQVPLSAEAFRDCRRYRTLSTTDVFVDTWHFRARWGRNPAPIIGLDRLIPYETGITVGVTWPRGTKRADGLVLEAPYTLHFVVNPNQWEVSVPAQWRDPSGILPALLEQIGVGYLE